MKRNEDKGTCRQKRNFDTEHKAKDLKPLMIGDIKDLKTRGKVLKLASSPRSHLIQSDCGIYRRNRRHLSYIETETNV